MSVRGRLASLALLTCLATVPAWAVQPDEILPNPVLEARARALSAELRCLVCQNQSIDDSAAPLARDLRLIVREHLIAGESDAQVKAFLVSRYGDFILLKPPFDRETLVLWLMPVAALIAGAATIALHHRRSAQARLPIPTLTGDEERRLAALTSEIQAPNPES